MVSSVLSVDLIFDEALGRRWNTIFGSERDESKAPVGVMLTPASLLL